MQWRGSRKSENIEDRRGATPRRGLVGGGLGTILLVLVAMYFGVDPSMLLNQGGVAFDAGTDSTGRPPTAADTEMRDFVATVLGYTEDAWTPLFAQAGRTYRPPALVLFTGSVQSACGSAQSAMGPFYCPGDEKVYLDTSFFDELSRQFQAPGDFAQAYVIAHEVGHHVQNLLGVSGQVEAIQRQASKSEGNRASVRLELQADCFAGVWAHQTEKAQQSQFKSFLETGDIEEALQAASQIGDDRLQMQAQGYVVPESFTHGTAAQRSQWFRTGLQTGDVSRCNTFDGATP